MSTRIDTPGPITPDDASFDPIAFATGAEGFDRGVTWAQLARMNHLLFEDCDPTWLAAELAWRKSYCFGYLTAQRVAARGR